VNNSTKHFGQTYKAQLAVLAAALSYTTLVLSSGWLTTKQVDLFTQVFWRSLFGMAFAGVLTFFFCKLDWRLNKKEFFYLLINAFIFLGGFTTFSGAIYLGTPLAKAVALNYAYPLIVIVLSWLLLREMPGVKQWIGVILSLISVFVLIEVWKVEGLKSLDSLSSLQIGDLVAFTNSWFYGGIIVFGRKLKMDTNLHPFKSLFYSYLFLLPLFLLLSLALSSQQINLLTPSFSWNYSIDVWLVLLGSAIFGSILPLFLIYYGVAKLKPFVASVLLLTEPLWVCLFAWLFFGQTLSFWSLVGAIGIILSVLLI